MDQRTEVFSAIEGGDLSRLEGLLDADPGLAGARDDRGVSAVLTAHYRGQAELEARLLADAPTLDVFDAAGLGLVDRLNELLDVDPELVAAVSPDGFTPLHLTAFYGHTHAAEALLGRGADAEAEADNETRVRPLNSAAAGGHSTIAHLLLDRGADVDVRQAGGFTPLHSAAHNGDVAMARLLLDRGADPHAPTDDGRTPLDFATNPEIVALLEATSNPDA
ncbi:MAG: hypothetical protein JWM05_1212 [Acidimicrobiales bacterium]|nr:hypothetical protein [Acidimicrobiales bacterium]